MKKKILKALAVAVCAILLVVGSVAGTLAYLTSKTNPITNTFTAGNVSITMDEAKVTPYGVKDGDTRVQTNEYKLIPGHTYLKDPTVYVDASSENCWIFVKIENGLGAAATLAMDNANWTRIAGTDVWYYNDVAEAGEKYTPFTGFTLDTAADVNALATQSIVVTAYAIQADNLNSATDAWTAAPAEWKSTNNG